MTGQLWRRLTVSAGVVCVVTGMAWGLAPPTGYALFPGVNEIGNLDATLPGPGLAIVQRSALTGDRMIRARATVPNLSGLKVTYSNGQTLALCNAIANAAGQPGLVAVSSWYRVDVAGGATPSASATLVGTYQ